MKTLKANKDQEATVQQVDNTQAIDQILAENAMLREQVAQLSDLNARLDKKLFTLRAGVSALSDKIKKVKVE